MLDVVSTCQVHKSTNTYIFQKWTVYAAVSISCRCKGQLSTKDCFVTLQIQTSTNNYIVAITFGMETVKEVLPCFILKQLYREIEGCLPKTSMACSTQIIRNKSFGQDLDSGYKQTESKVSEHISSYRLAISGFTIVSRLDSAAHAFGLVPYKK